MTDVADIGCLPGSASAIQKLKGSYDWVVLIGAAILFGVVGAACVTLLPAVPDGQTSESLSALFVP